MKTNKITYSDIASYTGFSKTTISRYFNRPSTLTPENQEVIRRALIALDYKENKVAKILASGESQMVGLLVPNLELHYFSEMVNQILLTYEEYGYKFILFVGDKNADAERRYLEELMSYQIEGLLIMSSSLDSQELSRFPLPVVSIEREDEYISSVNCDNYHGALIACERLKALDCEVLLHLNQPTPATLPAYKRIQGFEDFCQREGMEHRVLINDSGRDPFAIQKSMAQTLGEIQRLYPGKRKGIFLSDDTRASALLNQIVRRYGCLPEEYRLIGFDNSPVSQSAIYPISTVDQKIPTIAREAVSLLMERIRRRKTAPDSPLPPVHKVITPVLIERETTRGLS